MRRNEPVYAIPSWINGHAILQAARHFQDIRNPVTSAVVRRAPLCGRENLAEAMRCAQASLSSWADLGEAGRRQRLTALGEALQGVAEHVVALIAEENGMDASVAGDVVKRLVARMHRPSGGEESVNVSILSGAGQDFSDFVEKAIDRLAMGSALIVFPSLSGPSAWLVLAELSGQCAFPPGVLNILYASDEDATIWVSELGS